VKKLKVALLGGYPSDVDNLRGGVQAAVAYLLKGLVNLNGLEIHALTFQPSNWNGPDQFEQNGIKVHFLPHYPRFERLRNYRLFQSAVNQQLSIIKPDIVHAQEAGAEALVALRSGIPAVITAHGIRAEDSKFIPSFKRRFRFYFDSYLTERTVIKRVKYLIAISQYVTNYFSSKFQKDIQISYIPNAVDDRFFSQTMMSDGADILFVGRVIPLKRIHDLVQAFEIAHRQFPQSNLRIAGDISSDPGYTLSIRTQIKQAGLLERIHLLGQLDQTALLQEYRNSAFVVLPSAQENSPLVLAQAMAAGKPVIATRVGGVPEMLGLQGERGILVSVGDVHGVSTGMEELLKSPEKRFLMGQTAHEFAQDNFHPERVAQQTFNFYQYILEKEKNHE
jgi:glycosyltransferase involved in cell wall biosynthesis